jgi:tetratricopeptide (TPR) repeat protein
MQASPELRLERAKQMVEMEPYNLALRVERARLLHEAGRYAGALREIEFVRENSHDAIEGLDELERQARERRNEEIARLDEQRRELGALQAMTSSGAGNSQQYLDLAKAYTGQAAYDQAIDLLQEYLRANAGDVQARINYARVLAWDRRYPAAQHQYQILLRDMPDRADLRYEYAQALSYDADFVPAISTFRGLTNLSDNPRAHLYPDVPAKAYYNLGQIYRWYGWNDTAVQTQTRALELDSNYVDARRELTLARYNRPTSLMGATYT